MDTARDTGGRAMQLHGTVTQYVKILIHETQEEREFDTHDKAYAWMKKVSATLQQDITAEITKVVEETNEYWATYKTAEIGYVR